MDFLNCSSHKNRLLKDIQLLIIDNDRDSLRLYATLLEEYGANAVTAVSIAEALELVDWFLPEILICEMRFCGENIDTLPTKLSEMEKSSGNRIPAIAITAWITDKFAQVLDASFETYLLKPVDLDILVSQIESLLLPSRATFSNRW